MERLSQQHRFSIDRHSLCKSNPGSCWNLLITGSVLGVALCPRCCCLIISIGLYKRGVPVNRITYTKELIMADGERQERQPLLESQHRNQDNGKQKHIVDFDPNGDEGNPMEWTKKYRWIIVFFLSFMATTVYGNISSMTFASERANAE